METVGPDGRLLLDVFEGEAGDRLEVTADIGRTARFRLERLEIEHHRQRLDDRRLTLLGTSELLFRAQALGICAKLPSGYQRDLQLLKVPLFRGIDMAARTLQILSPAIDAMKFRKENIELDPAIHAAEEANAMVLREGISFREAYRRVGAKLKGKD